jgi:hypothetical protein
MRSSPDGSLISGSLSTGIVRGTPIHSESVYLVNWKSAS